MTESEISPSKSMNSSPDDSFLGAFGDGIRVVRTGTDFPSRVELSAGIAVAGELPGSLLYRQGAFIPRLPWRAPTERETNLLLARGKSVEPGAWIAIVRVPPEILGEFKNLREASRKMRWRQELISHLKTADCQRAVSFALKYVSDFATSGCKHLEGAGVFGNPPDLPTTTIVGSRALIGLHVDNWYKADLPARSHLPNRFCINLGLSNRHLLYINLTLRQLADALDSRGRRDQSSQEVNHGLRTAFMTTFPNYPVVKLRVGPGEAYIAPTENMIHDGCTTGQTTFDVQFSVRGFFEAFAEHRGQASAASQL